MVYCDTSFLVAAMTPEVNSDAARDTFRMHRDTIVVSDWNVTEFASAIAMKLRRGDIDAGQRIKAELAWEILRSEFKSVTVTAQHFTRAAVLVDSAPRGLRAGDALHLAIVLDQGCDLATFDRDMADAARALGVAVHPG